VHADDTDGPGGMSTDEVESYMLGEPPVMAGNADADEKETHVAASSALESQSKAPKRRGASATVRAATLDDLRQAWQLAIHVAEVAPMTGLGALPRDVGKLPQAHKGIFKRGER